LFVFIFTNKVALIHFDIHYLYLAPVRRVIFQITRLTHFYSVVKIEFVEVYGC